MRYKSSRGFSLLEIIVAMVILSMVVAGLFGLFVTSSQFIVEGSHRLTAAEYARMVAERLKVYVSADPNMPPNRDTIWGNPSTLPNLPALNIPGTTNAQCTYNVTNVGTTDIRQATITVTWEEP